MNLKSYSGIIFATTFIPIVIVLIIGFAIWYYHRESQCLMLIIMKGIVARKNIDRRPNYLVCNRKLPSASSRRHFFCTSVLIIALCVHCFFLVAIVEVTYQCIHDPDVDCFKKKDDVKLSDTFAHDDSPVNCSSISKDDFVTCYRITAFDPDRAFISAGAAYLLFKMLNFGLLLLSHTMIWVAQKLENIAFLLFKLVCCLIISIIMIIPLILRIYVDKVESAVRKVSYTVLIQVVTIVLVVQYSVGCLPWEKLGVSEKYYEDASANNDANDKKTDKTSPV